MNRDLSRDWCPEGISLSDASALITLEDHQRRQSPFATTDSDEGRAAAYLHLFTGLIPALEDANGRQRAVDLTLSGAAGELEIAEVTSTLDGRFQRNRAQSHTLVEQVDCNYHGATSWVLGFEHGWTLPKNALLPALATKLAAELHRLDALGAEDQPVEISADIVAYPIDGQQAASVTGSSWSANIPPSPETPYLDRLSAYLTGSDLIARKCSKLRNESLRLHVSRRHLYLLMASTGEEGGLLPDSPSYFTWGDFACPSPVTDLWLDGGTGAIYHWSDQDGWVFHRL